MPVTEETLFPSLMIMKSTRIPQLSSLEASHTAFPHLREGSPSSQTNISGEPKVEKISEKISECFSEDKGVTLRLEDEFSKELIVSVIKECQTMVSENSMTVENWNAIGEFLGEDLWEFSRLKEELVLADRKCGMVQQKASEISQFGEGDEMKNRLMACAMLLAETEMRRDHLEERVSMIVDEFVTRILSDFKTSASYMNLELRLRAVFGTL